MDIRIVVEGADHSGKSTAVALIARALEQAGAKVLVQKADPQIEEKLAAADEKLAARIEGVEVLIMELRTSK